MDDDEANERGEFQRLAELAMRRGFIKVLIQRDGPKAISTMELTPDGIELQRLLRKLLDIPKPNPESISADEVLGLLGFFILEEPLRPVD